jgi:phosphate transport system substrate-binding protein
MVVSARAFRRTIAVTAFAAALTVSPLLAAIAQALTLNGAGATFPAPLYERYFREFRSATGGFQVNYQAVGSGAGIRQVVAGTVDFGGSDAAMTDAQIEQVKRGVILVPTAGGAVTLAYNLPGVSNLKISRAVMAGIFSGQITRWKDAKIVADNAGVNLPDSPIKPVVRADSSGTTFVFTNHLSAIDPYFKGRIGVGTAPNWTITPLRGRGNAGIAAQVQRTEGTIGYVELATAKQNNLTVASVQNKKGDFVVPTLESTETALSTLTFPDNFRVFANDPEDGYPIAGLTWILIYKKYATAEQADGVKKLVQWMLTDGQKLNNELNYTKVPDSVAQKAIQTVNSQVTVGQ